MNQLENANVFRTVAFCLKTNLYCFKVWRHFSDDERRGIQRGLWTSWEWKQRAATVHWQVTMRMAQGHIYVAVRFHNWHVL